MHMVYDVTELPAGAEYCFWNQTGGGVSERGYDSAEVHYRGIQDAKGRLMVLATHNTDVSDTWEREGEKPITSTPSRRAATPSASTSSSTR